MPNYTPGEAQTTHRRTGNRITSILDIDFCNGLWIYVFPGTLSANDIWVHFRNFNVLHSRIRTPSHVHWTVDILIKSVRNQRLTEAFLKEMLTRWREIEPLPNRQMQTIINNLTYSRDQRFIERYQSLDRDGFFNMEFLTHLIELLMLQEKTNNPQAYMFRRVVEGILNSNDLYSILSTAGFRGR